jgi:hypothetical protein
MSAKLDPESRMVGPHMRYWPITQHSSGSSSQMGLPCDEPTGLSASRTSGWLSAGGPRISSPFAPAVTPVMSMVQTRPNLPGRLSSGLVTGSPGAGPSSPMPMMPSAPTILSAASSPPAWQLTRSPSSPHLVSAMSWKGTGLAVFRLPNSRIADATGPDSSVPSRVSTVSCRDHSRTPGQDEAEIALAKTCRPTEPVSSNTGTV